MLVSDIALRVKRQFGDEAGAQITDADIIRWVNDAQREVVATNDLLQIRAQLAFPVGIDTNTTDTQLPPNCLILRMVRLNTKTLKSMSYQEAMEQEVDKSTLAVPINDVESYYVFANRIYFYPNLLPNQGTHSLTVFYNKSPDEIIATNQTPELPDRYHNRLVDYCLAQAYLLDDNWEMHKGKMESFETGVEKQRATDEVTPQAFYPSITTDNADYGMIY